MKDRFYRSCFRDNLGGNVAFHRASKSGYTTNVAEAEVMTRTEAQESWRRGFNIPISADHVDAHLVQRVDYQYLTGTCTISETEPNLAYVEGMWAGNDVYWYCASNKSLDPRDAVRLDATQSRNLKATSNVVIVPQSEALKATREVFPLVNFNRRTMVQGAGIKMPEHIKRERNRKVSSKVRWNCPTCGKLSWQENPYDFDGCLDRSCDSFKDYFYG